MQVEERGNMEVKIYVTSHGVYEVVVVVVVMFLLRQHQGRAGFKRLIKTHLPGDPAEPRDQALFT